MTIETYIGNEGRVHDYQVLCPSSHTQCSVSDVPAYIRQVLSLAHLIRPQDSVSRWKAGLFCPLFRFELIAVL